MNLIMRILKALAENKLFRTFGFGFFLLSLAIFYVAQHGLDDRLIVFVKILILPLLPGFTLGLRMKGR